jgi:glucose-1-phosphate thymidylyltransferase
MKAIILAAGYATRLYPLTENTPKPLLPVQGKPIIDWIIDKLHAASVHDIYIVTNHKFYRHFQEWSNGRYTVVNDCTVNNETRLGAIGDIDYVIRTQHVDDDILVIAGDNLFSFSLVDFLNFFKEKKSTIVAVYDTQNSALIANKLGCVEVNKDNKIIGFEEKPEHPKTTLAATACYGFPKQHLHYVKEAMQRHSDRPGELVKFISEHEPVFAFRFTGHWFDIGTHDEYARVNKEKLI